MLQYVTDEVSKLFTNAALVNSNNTSNNNNNTITVDLNNNHILDKTRELAGKSNFI